MAENNNLESNPKNIMEAQTTASPTAPSPDSNICGLCKESYLNKEPKLLPCLHTFCKQCLDESANNLLNNSRMCSTCRTQYEVYEIIDNKFIVDHGNIETQNQVEEEHVCTGCEETAQATSFCIQCEEWLCDQCVQAHRRVKMTKDHSVQPKGSLPQVSSGEKLLFCPIHRQEQLKLYCETCEQLTCRDCQLSNHKEHRYQFLHEVSERHKEELRIMLNKIQEKRSYIDNAKFLMEKRFNEITEREQKVGNEIKVFAIKFIADINNRGKELLADLTAVCNAKKHQLTLKNKEIQQLYTTLDHGIQFTQQALETGSNSALLLSKRSVTNQLTRIMQTKCEVPNPNHNLDIRFQYDPNYMKNVLPRLGHLMVDGFVYNSNFSQSQLTYLNMSTEQRRMFQNLSPEQRQLFMARIRQKKAGLQAGNNVQSSSSGRSTLCYHPSLNQGRPVMNLNQLAAQVSTLKPILPRPPTNTALTPQFQQQLSTTFLNRLSPSSLTRTDTSPQQHVSSSSGIQGVVLPNMMLSPDYLPVHSMLQTAQRPSSPSSSSATSSVQVKTEPADKVEMPSCSIGAKIKSEPQDPPPNDGSMPTDSTTSMSGFPLNSDATALFNSIQGACDEVAPSMFGPKRYQVMTQSIAPDAIQKLMSSGSTDDPSEDYCAVCRNGGDLLCCDTCPKVFHLQCHVPALHTPPVGSWKCGLCQIESDVVLDAPDSNKDSHLASNKRKAPSGLTDREIKVCERILLELFCHAVSVPFHEPVAKSVPNYYKVILNPSDFLSIKLKISRQHFNHYNSIEDFIEDVRLVFTNCSRFNSDTSEVGKAGKDVENFFEQLLKKFMPWIEYRRETVTPSSCHSDSDGSARSFHKRKKRPDEIMHLPPA